MHNPVVWFEIYVQDIERAKTFYQQALNIQLSPLPMEGVAMQAFPSDNQWTDAPVALVQAAAGGTVVRGKMSIGEHGFCTMAQDPGSNLFDLHSMQ